MGIDSSQSIQSPVESYEQISPEELEGIKSNNMPVFRKGLKKIFAKHEDTAWIDEQFGNNIAIYGEAGNYENLRRLFGQEFLERKFDSIFLSRMFKYINWEEVLETTMNTTKSYYIIDYDRDFVLKTDKQSRPSLPSAEEVSKKLKKGGFEIKAGEKKETYFYIVAEKK
jgi:hypothetical protein